MTGIADLDRKTSGVHRRHTVYMAGRPSMGKSALAVVIAENVAKAGVEVKSTGGYILVAPSWTKPSREQRLWEEDPGWIQGPRKPPPQTT